MAPSAKGRQNPRAWQENIRRVIAKKPGRYMSQGDITRIERNIGRGVSRALKRSMMAEEVQAGNMKTASGHRTPYSPKVQLLAREGRANFALAKSHPHLAKVREKVRKWTMKKTQLKEGKRHLTAPKVQQMMKSLASRRGISIPDVEAAIITMTAEDGLTVEWRRLGHQGEHCRRKDIFKTAAAHLRTLGFSAKEAQRITQLGSRGITTAENACTAIDLGEGWGGASEGMRRVMRVVGVDKQSQNRGTTHGYTEPDVIMNFTKGQGNLVTKVMKKAGILQEELTYVHGSPDCGPETIMQRMEKTQARGKGPHAGKRRAQKQIMAIREIVTGIKSVIIQRPSISYTIEQPAESALKHHRGLQTLPGKQVVIKMCCYGYQWKKPTRIWTNLGKHWQPRCQQSPGWLKNCPHCEACRTGTKHSMYIIRRGPEDTRKGAQLQGYNKTASKNRIPPDLAEEWAKAAIARRTALTM